MNKSTLMAVTAIEYYQKNISPNKGYSCAHGALHNGPSCSSFSKTKIINEGLFWGAISTIRRFRQCWKASKILKIKQRQLAFSIEKDSGQNENKGKKSKSDSTDDCLTTYFVGETACCLLSLWPF